MWEEMSDLEKMNRLKDLQRRIFFDIKNQGNRKHKEGRTPYSANKNDFFAQK